MQEKLKKYKSNIIRTPNPSTLRPPQPNSREATFSISLLTCIELRIILTVLKFKVSDPFLQSSSGGINSFHSTHLKSQHNQVLGPLSIKSPSKRHLESIIAYPARLIDHILGRLSTSQQLQTSDHLHTFLHKININLKYKSTKS